MGFTSYQEVITYLYDNLPMFQRKGASAFRKDLDRTIQFDKLLGHPHRSYKTIHIAGTNGKGSTAHMLSAILQENGYKTGLYTSPHLRDFTERIRINGQQMSSGAVLKFVNEYYEDIQKIKPSFFEITFAMAVKYFRDEKVDIAVMETGMGGRLDSTNVISPILSVITNISFDHQQYLGDTLPEIAAEKAGIIKENTPVVINERQEEIEEVFINKAKEVNAPLHFASGEYRAEKNNGKFEIWFRDKKWDEELYVSLPGNYQRFNIPGVLKSVDILNSVGLNIAKDKMISSLGQVTKLTGLKGRYHLVRKKPMVIADVAHNEAGLAHVMTQLMGERFERLFMVIAVVNDKDLSKIWNILPRDAHYFFTQANIPRALPAALLYDQAFKQGFEGEMVDTIPEAYKLALEKASENDLIFVGGSTFTVAEIEELYNEDEA